MELQDFYNEWNNDNPDILVHTSGSTGQPKPLWVEKKRMLASARMTCDFLGLKNGDTALLCLPLDYIAGKMVVVRSIERGLRLIDVKPSNHPLDGLEEAPTFAAMVPSQVFSSLDNPMLREIKHLIIGGGAISRQMAETLRSFPNAVWSTYGMTETLSHIAMRRLSGTEASEWYTQFSGVTLSQDADNCLVIAPENPEEAVISSPLTTNDIVEFRNPSELNCQGNEKYPLQFRILGRRDNVICSGGIKIQAEEIERSLQPYMKNRFAIWKRPDEKFGEIVVLITEGPFKEARAACDKCLDSITYPKEFYWTKRLPLTETGKVARHKLFSSGQKD